MAQTDNSHTIQASTENVMENERNFLQIECLIVKQ